MATISDETGALPPPGRTLTANSPSLAHSPAMAIATAIAAGAVCDRWTRLSGEIWLTIGLSALLAAGIALRFRWKTPIGITLAGISLIALGGMRHHDLWWDLPENHIAHFTRDRPQPVQLEATLLAMPELHQPKPRIYAAPWQTTEFLSVRIRCRALDNTTPVTGEAMLYVSGDWIDATAGDTISLFGRLSRPDPPRNPGEFNYADWLRGQGIGAIVRCEHPRQITRQSSGGLLGSSLFSKWRSNCQRILQRELSAETSALASALLLGVRTSMDDDLRDAFVRTGTAHLLAISGLHIGLIAWMITVCGRIMHLSSRFRLWLLIAGLAGYACLTEFRPSVFRATVFLILFSAARDRSRAVNGFQVLGLTAVVLLLVNPASLFDIGAQLSFLAVAAIFAAQPLLARIDGALSLRERAAQGIPTPVAIRFVFFLRRWLLKGVAIAGAVWLFTLPLSAGTFHVIAPWGILMTLLLIPVIAAAMLSGLVLLIVGFLIPLAAPIPAVAVEGTLDFVNWFVTSVASLPSGWWSITELPAWLVAGYYLALLAAFVEPVRRMVGRFRWSIPIVWALSAGGCWFASQPAGELEVSVLSVGHGCAVVVRTPQGKTLVYDAGSIDGGRRAARALDDYLSVSGRRDVDWLLISHADSDHYSAVPDLLQRGLVGAIVVTPQFERSTDRQVLDLRDRIRRSGAALKEISAGDVIDLERDLRLRILHPVAGVEYDSDNAASLVVAIEYRGRRVLLAGDLEADGLQQLLSRPRLDADVLLAPHHGGDAANPPDLAAWASPETVVVSAGRRVNREHLHDAYGANCRILDTEQFGAVTVRIGADGAIEIGEFRERR